MWLVTSDNSSPKLGEVPEGQRGMAHQKQLYINIIKKAKHCSFSINGLRLTNVKTSFAAGFGLHHWSILEGELSEKRIFAAPSITLVT